MLYGDFVFGISLLQTILFALFAILTLFQGRLIRNNVVVAKIAIFNIPLCNLFLFCFIVLNLQ
nr:hypothetical protein [Leptospira noguchii]